MGITQCFVAAFTLRFIYLFIYVIIQAAVVVYFFPIDLRKSWGIGIFWWGRIYMMRYGNGVLWHGVVGYCVVWVQVTSDWWDMSVAGHGSYRMQSPKFQQVTHDSN